MQRNLYDQLSRLKDLPPQSSNLAGGKEESPTPSENSPTEVAKRSQQTMCVSTHEQNLKGDKLSDMYINFAHHIFLTNILTDIQWLSGKP